MGGRVFTVAILMLLALQASPALSQSNEGQSLTFADGSGTHFTMLDHHWVPVVKDGWWKIHGLLQNDTDLSYNLVVISAKIYSKEGALLDTKTTSITHMDGHEIWEFWIFGKPLTMENHPSETYKFYLQWFLKR
jgi:hypothetical protein